MFWGASVSRSVSQAPQNGGRFRIDDRCAHALHMRLDATLTSWARRHHGLLTADQWTQSGRSRRLWYRTLDAGLLEPVRPGVARLPGAPATPAQAIAAALWSIEGDVLASHRSAAWLWGATPIGDDPIDIIALSRSRLGPRSGVAIHRPRDLVDLRPATRHGMATCNPLRCLVDIGAVDAALVGDALESMLIAGLVSVRAVEAALERHRRRGRHGVVALDAALADLALGKRAPDSVLEARMAALLTRVGVDGWRFHHRVAGHEVDFALPSERIVIEVDGWATHGRRAQFEHDRRRDADLVVAGWVVLRFTWLQVTRRPTWVASRIVAAVEARTPAAA
jgi:very-short-patch-repair endonuclease